MTRTTNCPDLEAIRRFLDESLDSIVNEEVAGHVEHCGDCRATLESLCGPIPSQWKTVGEGDETLAPWIRHLVETSHADSTVIGPPESWPVPNIPGFTILGPLGRGGMGLVFRAKQESLGREVALKILIGGAVATGMARERFRREAEAVARLKHPNIVSIHDVGEHAGSPYLCLELVDGLSLAKTMDGSPWQPRRAAELIAILAEALSAVHAAGIVHRDLKPGNILFDAAGVPKLADFGLAKFLEHPDGMTRTGDFLGTPTYMAPEQLTGPASAVGPSADIHALCVILHELLAGSHPFEAESTMAVALRILRDPPPDLGLTKLDRNLEAITRKCLEKAPKDRYASASALAADLRLYLAGEPPELGRTTNPTGKRIDRRAALATLSLGTIAVASGSWYSITRKKTASGRGVIELDHDVVEAPFGKLIVMGRFSVPESPTSVFTHIYDMRDMVTSRNRMLKSENVEIKNERTYPISYWAPVQTGKWAILEYKYDVDFPIAAATIRAALVCPGEDGFEADLQVSADGREDTFNTLPKDLNAQWQQYDWKNLTMTPHDISTVLQGSKTAHVRVKMFAPKGTEVNGKVILPQFLRTATNSLDEDTDGQCILEEQNPFVYHFVAANRPAPRLTATVDYGDSSELKPLALLLDGTFPLRHDYKKNGTYRVEVVLSDKNGEVARRTLSVVAKIAR